MSLDHTKEILSNAALHNHADSIKLAMEVFAYCHGVSIDVQVAKRREDGAFTAKYRRSGEFFWHKVHLWVVPSRKLTFEDLTYLLVNMKLVLT